jgi:hypothetical protein
MPGEHNVRKTEWEPPERERERMQGNWGQLKNGPKRAETAGNDVPGVEEQE